jgi:hypothetical protein
MPDLMLLYIFREIPRKMIIITNRINESINVPLVTVDIIESLRMLAIKLRGLEPDIALSHNGVLSVMG